MSVRNSIAAKRQHGFTLIELLIVIVVISILALIVIPRLSGTTRRAKESTIKADLQKLREAIYQFVADTGANPNSLTDLNATTAPANGVDDSGNTVAITIGTYGGPYILRQGGIGGAAVGIPINPFTPLASGSIDPTLSHHWGYLNGVVWAAAPTSGTTLEGIPYNSL